MRKWTARAPPGTSETTSCASSAPLTITAQGVSRARTALTTLPPPLQRDRSRTANVTLGLRVPPVVLARGALWTVTVSTAKRVGVLLTRSRILGVTRGRIALVSLGTSERTAGSAQSATLTLSAPVVLLRWTAPRTLSHSPEATRRSTAPAGQGGTGTTEQIAQSVRPDRGARQAFHTHAPPSVVPALLLQSSQAVPVWPVMGPPTTALRVRPARLGHTNRPRAGECALHVV